MSCLVADFLARHQSCAGASEHSASGFPAQQLGTFCSYLCFVLDLTHICPLSSLLPLDRRCVGFRWHFALCGCAEYAFGAAAHMPTQGRLCVLLRRSLFYRLFGSHTLSIMLCGGAEGDD